MHHPGSAWAGIGLYGECPRRAARERERLMCEASVGTVALRIDVAPGPREVSQESF